MSQAVLVKSFQNGLQVLLDQDLLFDDLLLEIENKFKESAKFFQDARLALSLEGRSLTIDEEKKIVDTITHASGIHIVCLINKEESKNQIYLNAIHHFEQIRPQDSQGEFYHGCVKDGETIESDASIVIFGDVYPDCTVISKKDIIVLGGLYGKAVAGAEQEEEHIIIALEMAPQKLKINGIKLRTDKQGKWPIKPKIVPKMARIQNDKIVMEILTKETLASVTRGSLC